MYDNPFIVFGERGRAIQARFEELTPIQRKVFTRLQTTIAPGKTFTVNRFLAQIEDDLTTAEAVVEQAWPATRIIEYPQGASRKI